MLKLKCHSCGWEGKVEELLVRVYKESKHYNAQLGLDVTILCPQCGSPEISEERYDA